MKTKITLISLFLTIVVGNTMAQDANQAYTDTMNAIFQQIDKSKITTGLLVDYGLQIVAPEYFNGIPADSNYVDMDTWKMLYGGIYTSKINNNANLPLPETVFAAIDNTQSGAVPLAMMHFQYNKLNDDAVSLNLLKVVNNQLVEIPGAASPYLTKQLFAVAPQSLYFTTSTASFVFKQSLWFSNSGKTVQKLEINFNNESGYKTAAWDAPVSYTFGFEGQKTIYFRLTYTDGSSYTSQTNVRVEGGSPTLRSSGTDIEISEIIIAASTLHSGGKIQIKYASSNTTGQLRKPLIVAEGFDAWKLMSGLRNTDIYVFLDTCKCNNFGTINSFYSDGNLKNNIDLSQYDIVYLDYNDGTDDIRRNAKLFEQVIDTVNALKVGGQPNVVMGLSMGGLVARYALREIELAGKDHQTWKFISVDAPHKGANVPVSVQAAVRHLEDLDLKVFFVKVLSATDIFSNLKGAINLLNSKAAKQMLIYQVTKNLTYNNSEYTSFMQEYDAMGFPQRCKNVAIADGNGQGSKIFTPESKLVIMNESYTLKWWMEALNVLFGSISGITLTTNYPQLVINVIPGKTQLYASVFANALPDKKVSKIYEGRAYYKKTILWLIPVTVDLTKKSMNSTSDMLPIDGAPGGLYDIERMMNLDSTIMQYVVQKRFCFVPTVSALGLSNWKDKLNENLQNEDFYASGTSNFDQYFTPATNDLHTRLNLSAQFLYTQLISPPIYFDTPSSSFNFLANVALKNPMNIPVSWSISNNNIGLNNPTNTSVNVYCYKANETGILKASSSIPLSPPLSTALGATSISNEVRKRITAKNNDIYIYGEFLPTDSLAVLRVYNWVEGTPVAWELSDNTNFRIASVAADSIVIEFLSYNKPLTVKATLQFVGQNISAQRTIASPELSIETPPKFDCRKTPVRFYPRLSPNIDNVEWSLSSTDYIQFEGATNVPVTFLRGLKNTLAYKVTLTLKLTTAGEQFTVTKPIEVAIPESFGLRVEQIYKTTKPYKILVHALPDPFNDRDAFYRWRSSSGTIKPCVENYNPYGLVATAVSDFVEESDFAQLATAPLTNGNQIPVDQLNPLLVSALADVAADASGDLADATCEESVNADDLVITRLATVDSNSGTDAVVISVSKSSSAQGTVGLETDPSAPSSATMEPVDNYIVLANPYAQPCKPIDDPDLAFTVLENVPSYAVLTYNGEDVTITCQFVSPCQETLTASVFITGSSFTCTYTNDNHCITIINDNNGDQGGGSTGTGYTGTGNTNTGNTGNNPKGYYDPVTGMWMYLADGPIEYQETMLLQTYSAYIYNDFGLVKTVSFNSSVKTVNISMNGQPAGFYYVNIVDEQGNVVSRQTVRVY